MTKEVQALVDAVAAHDSGDPIAARMLRGLTSTKGESTEDQMVRCVAYHYLADAQQDLREELRCDQRALEIAEAIEDKGTTLEVGTTTVSLASFMPSLYLGVAAGHAALGDLDAARQHAHKGRAAAMALPDTPHTRMTVAALERMLARFR